MAKKYIFSGYDVAAAAYVHFLQSQEMPKPPDGYVYDWTVTMSDPNDRYSLELSFTLAKKKPEPTPEPYQAGDWKDETLEQNTNEH